MPSYGTPEDVEAVQKLNRLCPEATVVPVPCLNLAREGGVLQCISICLDRLLLISLCDDFAADGMDNIVGSSAAGALVLQLVIHVPSVGFFSDADAISR